MLVMMPCTGSSPLTSSTSNLSPKSVNDMPKKPRTSAAMKPMPLPCVMLLTLTWSSRLTSVATTSWYDAICAGDSSPASADTFTYWFSSASRGAVTSARFLPMSASVRKNCDDRSSSATACGSHSVMLLTPASATFLAISTPRPLRPMMRMLDAFIRFMASAPSTYLASARPRTHLQLPRVQRLVDRRLLRLVDLHVGVLRLPVSPAPAAW
ncbi:uncharacterized protein V1510DRAFT_415722 [Dipodascopsis tothii]|uniref:uncharacterized protein n=1 Tax=Dipodascopsis tothii TaxID=44089 RepID=UPI0034CD3D22